MRVLLPKLERQSAEALMSQLESNLLQVPSVSDAAERKLYATLRLAEEATPVELRGLLLPLALHEQYVDDKCLALMASQVASSWKPALIEAFLHSLTDAGLVSRCDPDTEARFPRGATFEIHPLFSSYLRATVIPTAAEEVLAPWRQAFVRVCVMLAGLSGDRLDKQRQIFRYHSANLRRAWDEAKHLEMVDSYALLTMSLGAFALNCGQFVTAERLYTQALEANTWRQRLRGYTSLDEEAATYHALGMATFGRRDFSGAEGWYRKSLAINERIDKRDEIARDFQQLAILELERSNANAAEDWLKKSIAIKEERKDFQGLAASYHEMGIVAETRGALDLAENWYNKAVELRRQLGDELGCASSYHHLGKVAQRHGDYDAAQSAYKTSIEIDEKYKNELGMALTYYQLGKLAEAHPHPDPYAAEVWYKKALFIQERLGDHPSVAATYHNLGRNAEQRRDTAAAKEWYKKALQSEGALGNMQGMAMARRQLALLGA
jgi:tetratricopeptide (TPR) repeat protein